MDISNKIENYWDSGTNSPNITNSIDTTYIHCDLVSSSLDDGKYGDVIYTLSNNITANLDRSFPFSLEPIKKGYSEVNKYTISSITIYITDVLGRIIDLNGVDVSFSFIIKES